MRILEMVYIISRGEDKNILEEKDVKKAVKLLVEKKSKGSD